MPEEVSLPDREPAAVDLTEADVEAAQKLVEEQEYGSRRPGNWTRWLVPIIAAAWSLFQLSLPLCLPWALENWNRLFPVLRFTLNEDVIRAVHLSFALVLVFLSFAPFKKSRSWLPRFLTAKDRLPWLDLVLAVSAGALALYYIVDYRGIAARQGAPNTRDIVIGVLLLALLLEAARRSLGPALSVIALCFIGYCFINTSLPQILAFGPVTLKRLINQQILGTEGIYGVPLGVSATTVFLFVLFGMMLEKSGGGRFFVQLAFSLVGRFKGGPAKAAVLASGLTGLVSGSSIANAVTTGTFTIPLMKKSGYPAEKAAAVEVAASTNGQLMPPIMGAAAFIIAEYCRVPYMDVVKAAFIPAVVSYLALIYITHLEACKLRLKPIAREDIPMFWSTLGGGVHFLIPLALLIFMLLVMRYSPELSAFWAVLALAVLIPVKELVGAGQQQRPMRLALRQAGHQLWESLVAGGRGMMGIGVACAAAGIVIGVVSLGPGGRITEMVETLSGGSFIAVLVLTAIASLVLGMGLPTTATYLVMASLTAPIIVEISKSMPVDFGLGASMGVPLIAAHLFCFFFGILADDTPPVGLAAYAAAAVARSNPIPTGVQGFLYDLRTAILPFFFIFNTDLLLWKVTSFWQGAVIFVASTAAMFAFAALTQWFTVAKNRWYESVVLGLSTLLLLRPRLVAGLMTEPPDWLASKYLWYVVGLALYAGVIALQWPRRHAARPDAVEGQRLPKAP